MQHFIVILITFFHDDAWWIMNNVLSYRFQYMIFLGGNRLGLNQSASSSVLIGQESLDKEAEVHRGAKLVHMGDGKFCLVESMFHNHKDERHLHRDPTTVDLDLA